MGRAVEGLTNGPGHRAVLIAAAFLITVSMLSGCGGGGPEEFTFSIRKAGVVVGSETFSREEAGGLVTYRSRAVRPFLQYDSSFDRRFSISPGDGGLSEFRETRRQNGVAYRTLISSNGGVYEYLRDGLQMFAYARDLDFDSTLLALEPECAATVQAVIDRLREDGTGAGGGTLVVVPSLSMVGRQAELVSGGDGRATLRVAGIGDLEVTFEPSTGLLDTLRDPVKDLTIESDDPGRLASEPYAPTKRVVKEVRVPTTDGRELAGSFYVPKAKPPFKVAVLVGDFGPQDRTGAGLLSQVADRLAGDGIAVLTCDRRGVPPSEGKYVTYTLQTAVDDLNSQIDYLILRSDINTEKMFVVGHGEGGIVATYAAASNPYVTACVLMATPSVTPFPELARQQVAAAAASGELDPADAAIADSEIEALLFVLQAVGGDYVEAMGRSLFLGWMRGYQSSDVLTTAGTLKMPVLVLQGGADTGVTPDQATALYSALQAREKGVEELVVFEGLSHGFGREVGEAAAKPSRSHPLVTAKVERTVSGWLEER